MKTICVNDKDRPSDIPTSYWVKKGNEYTIIEVVWMEMQNKWGVKIEEIDLRPFYPWKYFAYDRFALTQEDIIKFLKKDEIVEPSKKEEKVEILEEEYA